MDPITLTAEDAGKTIEISRGDTFQVSLDGNPTTGYNWYPVSQNPTILEQTSSPTYQPTTNKLGSAGMITLNFKAVASGKTTLNLVYRRSWENGAVPVKTHDVNLEVK